MKILALDTSTNICTVALAVNDAVQVQVENSPRVHAQMILPMVDALLTQANLTCKDLDLIAFCHGPGSFTGVRIATSVAQGLAYAHNLQVVGVSSLQMIAQSYYQAFGAKQQLVCIDARMGEVYYGEYEFSEKLQVMLASSSDKLAKPSDVNLTSIDAVIGVGNAFSEYQELATNLNLANIAAEFTHDAKSVCAIASIQLHSAQAFAINSAQPVYLRNKVVN